MLARVVWLTDSAWPGLDERRAHLLGSLRLSASVLVLEPPAPMRPPDPAIRRSGGVAVAQVIPLLNTRLRWAQAVLGLPPLRRATEWIAGCQVARRVRRAGWTDHDGPMTVVCSIVFLHRAARSLHPDRLVVEISHDPRSVDGAPFWTADILMRAAHEADVVMTSSFRLETELRSEGVRDVRLRQGMPGMGGVDLLVQAIELSLEGSSQGAPARASRVAPAVEFHGQVGHSVDLALVDKLARRCHELRVRLVGPVDPVVAREVGEIGRRGNVDLLPGPDVGRVANDAEEPAAVIFPFLPAGPGPRTLPGSATEEVDVGVPIISTVRPERSTAARAVDVCPSRESFIQMVRLRTRRRVAESHSWERAASGSRQLRLPA